MAVVAVLHHLEDPFLGQVGPPLRDAGVTLDERRRRHGDPLPALDEVDGIVVLGGDQSVREIRDHPYLAEAADYLREAVRREVPVFGVCLGGQLLSHALGGTVVAGPRRAVGWRHLRPTAAAADDPVFGALPDDPAPALHWNEDEFTLPPGAVEVLVAEEAAGVEAFRYGSRAWGVQFHPDVDRPALDGWYAGFAPWLEEAGVSEDEARAADDAAWSAHERTARALFGNFARVVRGTR